MPKTKTDQNQHPFKELSQRWGISEDMLADIEASLHREGANPLIKGIGVQDVAQEGPALLEDVITRIAGLKFTFGQRITLLRNLTGDLVLAGAAHSIIKRHFVKRGVGQG